MPAPKRSRRAAPMAPDARRDAILTAILPLLLERGPEVTTRDLADAAGVAEGTLFRVFPDKRAMVRAAVDRVIDPAPLLAQLAEISEPDLRSTVRRIAGAMQLRARDVVATMILARSVLAGEADATGRPVGFRAPDVDGKRPQDHILAAMVPLFEPFAGELRRPPSEAARLLIALVFATVHPGVASTAVEMDADDIADLLLNGIARRTV